jgi:hypothetical protein
MAVPSVGIVISRWPTSGEDVAVLVVGLKGEEKDIFLRFCFDLAVAHKLSLRGFIAYHRVSGGLQPPLVGIILWIC